MRPQKLLALDEDVCTVLAKALITRFSPFGGKKIAAFTAKKYVPMAAILQWGRIQVAEGGDTMCCRAMIKSGSLGRDSTYVRASPSQLLTFPMIT